MANTPPNNEPRPVFDPRRGIVKIGAFSIFIIGAPVIFATRFGLEGLIIYISLMALFRLLSSIVVSEIMKHNPTAGLRLYARSPLLLVLSAAVPWANLPEEALVLMTVFNGSYIGLFWTCHFGVNQYLGGTTEDYQFTEVVSSAVGAMLSVALTIWGSVELAVGVGGAFCLAGSMIPLGIEPGGFKKQLTNWSEEAVGRPVDEIQNGLTIVIATALVNFSSLTTLRIETLVGTSVIAGVVSLGIAIAGTEVFVYYGTRRVPLNDPGLRRVAFVVTTAGFVMMFIGSPAFVAAGYWLITTISRSHYRVADRSLGRSALRGIGGRPGAREQLRYSVLLLLCPLLLIPDVLPLFGTIGAYLLLKSDFRSSDENGRNEDECERR